MSNTLTRSFALILRVVASWAKLPLEREAHLTLSKRPHKVGSLAVRDDDLTTEELTRRVNVVLLEQWVDNALLFIVKRSDGIF